MTGRLVPAAAESAAAPRNIGIDCLRGVAIVLVIVHHLALRFRLPLGPSLAGDWLPRRLVNALSFSGYEAVFLFFVISGFLIARRIVAVDGSLEKVRLRRFYRSRAWRIAPLLLVTLAVLTALAALGVPGFAPDPAAQSIGGLVGSALTLTFNWYEGRTGWAPAGWDVLWSLSIEEAFYLGFPLLCRWLPRRALIGVLLAWACLLGPLRDLVPQTDEVWREKAYLPGMAALAWGVLAAQLSLHWRIGPGAARLLVCGGGCGIVLALGWGRLLHSLFHSLFHGASLYLLCLSACCILMGFAACPPRPRTRVRWLARMGALSYELYLSHMLIVLATVAGYRAILGQEPAWTFMVYVPVLLACYGLAVTLNQCMSHLLARIRPPIPPAAPATSTPEAPRA